MQHDFPPGDRDLLIGAGPICGYVNSLLDPGCQVTVAVIYAWIAREHLPVKRIGNRLVASKAALRRHLFPIERGAR